MEGNSKDRTFWLAGELAKAAGVSTDTLRHYERKRVLARPGRAANGYRQYPENALDRVLLVRSALAVGFTLDELAGILGERERGGAPCREVRALAAEKLVSLEDQLKRLSALRDELEGTIANWDSRLAKTKPGARAGLLETLGTDGRRSSTEKSKLPPNFTKKEGKNDK
jgi:DNA-binding transcriptional MerR regulator